MIDKISVITARAILKNAPDHPTSEAVLKYALEGVYNVLFILVFTLGISIATHRIPETFTCLISFALLRQISGGIHLKSGVMCVLVSTLLFTALSFIEINQTEVNWLIIGTIILLLFFAPSRIERQSRIPKKFYPHLKLASVIVVVLGWVFGSSYVVMSFFVQALTLIRLKGGEHYDQT
ncbi:putative regulator protein [compost metagenome]